jgi:hypothetical protein
MSTAGISAAASQLQDLKPPSFANPAHKKANADGQGATGAGAIGQIPVGAGQNLFASALQSLESVISKAI